MVLRPWNMLEVPVVVVVEVAGVDAVMGLNLASHTEDI